MITDEMVERAMRHLESTGGYAARAPRSIRMNDQNENVEVETPDDIVLDGQFNIRQLLSAAINEGPAI